jgi:hypothetical protein
MKYQFLMRIILERAKNETAYTNEKGKIRFRSKRLINGCHVN